MKLQKTCRCKGTVEVPGDKSISHRTVMFGALAEGLTEVNHFLWSADCLSTIACFRILGIEIEENKVLKTVCIHGKGLYGLSAPSSILDVGNSGTTMRLLSGILCGQSFSSTLTGDTSIRKRPMKRVIDPLRQMNALIESQPGNGCAPLNITGREKPLTGIHYHTPVASAQVKSALLLAGLYADTTTTVTEPDCSRNHTELLLKRLGADIRAERNTVSILPGPQLSGAQIFVPGDISSAAYFIAAGLLLPKGEVLIKQVGINPTRDGILRVCKAMGAIITLENEEYGNGEPIADLLVSESNLEGTKIGGELIPALIDEIPIIAVMACFAKGETIIYDAEELKVKESNRLDVMVEGLSKMGADIQATNDGMVILGGRPLHGAVIDSHADHRIAMAFSIAALLAEGETEILGAECVTISYPEFYNDLQRLLH